LLDAGSQAKITQEEAHHYMKKIACLFALVVTLGTTSLMAEGWDWNFDRDRDRQSMPEPTAIPELAACVAGLGFVALRRRKPKA